jgi:hypothetical protein
MFSRGSASFGSIFYISENFKYLTHYLVNQFRTQMSAKNGDAAEA